MKIKINKLRNNTGQIEGVPKNPRLIKDDKYQTLLRSIKETPEMLDLRELIVYPIDKDTFVTVMGNMRLSVARELKMKELPCKILSKDTPPEKIREYSVKDNLNYGSWDYDLLNEWDDTELEDWGLNLPDIEDEDEQPPKDSEPQVDKAAELNEKWQVKPGDMFQIGNHRLLCGDSTKQEDVDRLMGGDKADIWITDPPYGVSYADKNNFLNKLDKGNRCQTKIENDHHSIEEMAEFWEKAAINAYLNCSDKSSYYWFACQGGDQMMMMMMMSITRAKWKVRHELIWVKNNHVLGRCDYSYKHEPILYGWKQDGTHKFYGGFQTSIFEIDKPLRSEFHPTTKPVEIISKLLNNSTLENEKVFDGFLGSGTTMVAAENLKRKCYGIEISPDYCAVILERMKTTFPDIEIKNIFNQ